MTFNEFKLQIFLYRIMCRFHPFLNDKDIYFCIHRAKIYRNNVKHLNENEAHRSCVSLIMKNTSLCYTSYLSIASIEQLERS